MSYLFKKMLANQELIRVFGIGRIVHPVMIDLLGLCGGYHGFWLDQEHGGLTYDQICIASGMARANGLDTFVRLAPTDYARVTQALEAGAGGVMAARIESAAQTEEFLTWAKFAPRGLRGLNTSGFDASYTHKSPQQFTKDANEQNFIAIQIETAGALAEVDQIAAVPDVDMLFIGPSDLSQALGILGDYNNPQMWEAVEKVAVAAEKNNIHWGILPPTPDYATRCIDLGCKLLLIGSDVRAIRSGLVQTMEQFGEVF